MQAVQDKSRGHTRPVVLVCGVREEEPVSLLLDALHERDCRVVFVDQGSLGDNLSLRWQLSDAGLKGTIRAHHSVFDINDIRSAFVRLMRFDVASASPEDRCYMERAESLMRSLGDLLDLLPGKIVNRRRPMMSNNSKPYQALLIKRCGFSIPETLITNVPRALLQSDMVRRPTVYKSISSVRSIVTTVTSHDWGRMGHIACLPTQFQEKLDGYCVRVHVIGREALATRIHTDATDYRYASLQGGSSILAPMDINTDLKQRCIRLARELELDFCGIDLMITDSSIVCLEVNPCPGYSYYETATGQPIAATLAAYLTG